MNREDRIRRELPDTLEDRAAELAGLPADQVDLIVAALRASHRAGRQHEKELKRQRKTDDKKHGNYDESQLAARNLRLVTSTGKRASANLDALASLVEFTRHSQATIDLAVDGLRANGVSDTDIGVTLGRPPEFARQAVGRKYGRRGKAVTCSQDDYTETAVSTGPDAGQGGA